MDSTELNCARTWRLSGIEQFLGLSHLLFRGCRAVGEEDNTLKQIGCPFELWIGCGQDALAFSRDRHDFPTSDIVRTHNQGLLLLDAMRQLDKQMQSASGEFKLLALLGRHARLDGIGIKDLYRLGRTAFALNPDQIKSITVPYTMGTCLGLGSGAQALFADFRDDGVVETAG